MKVQDLGEKTAEELQSEVVRLRREHFSLRMQNASGQLGQPHLLKEIRSDIARVKTVMKESKDVRSRKSTDQSAYCIRSSGQRSHAERYYDQS